MLLDGQRLSGQADILKSQFGKAERCRPSQAVDPGVVCDYEWLPKNVLVALIVVAWYVWDCTDCLRGL